MVFSAFYYKRKTERKLVWARELEDPHRGGCRWGHREEEGQGRPDKGRPTPERSAACGVQTAQRETHADLGQREDKITSSQLDPEFSTVIQKSLTSDLHQLRELDRNS